MPVSGCWYSCIPLHLVGMALLDCLLTARSLPAVDGSESASLNLDENSSSLSHWAESRHRRIGVHVRLPDQLLPLSSGLRASLEITATVKKMEARGENNRFDPPLQSGLNQTLN